jgi:hypothetical protein
MSNEVELIPEGIFGNIINAAQSKINEIKRNIFYAMIPKKQIMEAMIALINTVEELVTNIVQRTSLTVQEWVEMNFDLIIERMASYVGIVQIPQGDGEDVVYCATGVCEEYVPELESPESMEIVLLVIQLLIPIFRKWFS